ncbi:DUF6404 family protein [Shewanella sp. H8]
MQLVSLSIIEWVAWLIFMFMGLLFGFFMALYFKHSAKKNNLSNWLHCN